MWFIHIFYLYKYFIIVSLLFLHALNTKFIVALFIFAPYSTKYFTITYNFIISFN